MKWMVPISKLNPEQTSILETLRSAPHDIHWISGYAGTGKTIVLTHAIERTVARTTSASICFATYTHALKDLVESGLSARARERVHITTVDGLNRLSGDFDYIFVDEIQDIKDDLIRSLLGKTKRFVAAGDTDQSIFLGRVKPEDLKRILRGAATYELKQIERMTKEVFEIAAIIRPKAKITRVRCTKESTQKPRWFSGKSQADEFRKVLAEAYRVAQPGIPSAVLLPLQKLIYAFGRVHAHAEGWGDPPPAVKTAHRPIDYRDFNAFFAHHRSPLRFFGSDNGSLDESTHKRTVYVMTYHSAKGLDFSSVFLPNLTVGTNLDAKGASFSILDREELHLFVAATRSKDRLYMSYHGGEDDRHELLERVIQHTSPSCIEHFQPPRAVFGQ
jgi:superfamily I DNA/RNA helicase